MIEPLKDPGNEDCKFEYDGICYALICYCSKKCRARNKDGTDWRIAEGEGWNEYMPQEYRMQLLDHMSKANEQI